MACLGEDDVSKLLKEAGVSADKESLKLMISKVKSKPLTELIAEGQEKMASMPSGKYFTLSYFL